MLHRLNLTLYYLFTDILAFFYRLYIGGELEKTIICDTLSIPVFSAKQLHKENIYGQTIGRNIFIRADRLNYADTRNHELQHVYQSHRLGFIFVFLYFWELITRGYYANSFELDARKHESTGPDFIRCDK